MKIFVPDPCTPWRLASLSMSYSYGEAEEVLIDVGLRRAKHGVSISDFLKFVQKVKSRLSAEGYLIVVPDVYGNAKGTHRNWLKFAPRLRPHGELVYVAQGFVLPREWGGVEPRIVALPARSQNGRSCHREVTYCVSNIMRFINEVDSGVSLHLLGPAKAVLVMLRQWGYLDRIASFDTASYRRAPTREAKEMVGGRWQVVKGLECVWFNEWSKGVV
jgi:hypothetical protein